MLTASSTDGDRHIASIGLVEVASTASDEVFQFVEESKASRIIFQKLDDFCVETGLGAQFVSPIGIGQCSGIKDKVGVRRNATFKSKRLEQYREAISLLNKSAGDHIPQCSRSEISGIDEQIRIRRDRLKMFPFA